MISSRTGEQQEIGDFGFKDDFLWWHTVLPGGTIWLPVYAETWAYGDRGKAVCHKCLAEEQI